MHKIKSGQRQEDKLIELIKVLKPNEYKELYIKIGGNNGQETKVGRLLKLYYEEEKVPAKEIHASLGYKGSEQSLHQLRYRLKLTLKSYLSSKSHKYNTKSTPFNNRLELIKGLIEADILHSKGQEKEAIKIVEKAHRLFGDSTLSPEESMCLDRLIRYGGPNMTLEELINVSDKQERVLTDLLISNKAHKLYYKCMHPIFNNSESFESKKLEIENAIHSLGRLHSESRSDSCRYYYLRLSTYYHINIGDYQKAMSNAQMFFQLIRNSRKHNTISNKSGAILQIGNIAAYDNQPRTAIKYYKEALSMFPARSSNSIRVAYAIISCNVLLEQYEKAMSIVDSLKELVFKIGDSAILNTWLYRKAYLSHLLNDNKVALRILTSELSVSSKDEEWFFASRFLELQCLWADREYDVYDSRIISLRRNPLYKNIKRNNRNYIISQLLSQLSTTQYKSRRFKIEEGIEALNGNDINYRWDPYGFELLRFEKWWWSSAKV